MRAVIQRVTSARVSIAGRVVAEIGHGFVALVGIARQDGADDIRYLVTKICQMALPGTVTARKSTCFDCSRVFMASKPRLTKAT